MNMQKFLDRYRYLLTALIFFLVGSATLFAGGAGEGVEDEEVIKQADFVRPRRMVFLFDVPSDTFTDFEKFFVYNSVLTDIYGANPEVVILESEEQEVPPTVEARQELVRRVDADSWVFVQVQGDVSNVTFYHETYDLLTIKKFGEKTIETGLRLDLRTLSRGDIWRDLVIAIQDNYSNLLDQENVTITGLPGTVIADVILQNPVAYIYRALLDGYYPTGTVIADVTPNSEIVLDATGDVTVALQNPAAYTYRALLDGYYPIQEEFFLGFEPRLIELEQKPTISWSVDFLLNNFQFVGVRAYWFPVPADWFIRFGFTTYAFGLYLIDNSPAIIGANPLTVITLQTGLFLFDKINLLRPYLALGAGLRVEHSTTRVGLAENTPVELSLVAGVEYSFPDRFLRVYAEYSPTMYISEDITEFKNASFLNYLLPDGTAPGYVSADNLSFDLRSFSVGVRLSF